MGFIRQQSEFRALGGAVLSSSIEIDHALKNSNKIQKLQLLNKGEKSQIEDEALQNSYYYVNEIDEILD